MIEVASSLLLLRSKLGVIDQPEVGLGQVLLFNQWQNTASHVESVRAHVPSLLAPLCDETHRGKRVNLFFVIDTGVE